MDILSLSIIVFIIMETANVIILYFKPDFKYGNGVSVFKFWEDSKKDENAHLFAKYMTNWVAGTKLIFIVLLLVVLFVGTQEIKFYSVIVMILSIATYYFRLNPIIKKLDNNRQIQPKGYSKTLQYMITGFITMFSVALLVYIIQTYIV